MKSFGGLLFGLLAAASISASATVIDVGQPLMRIFMDGYYVGTTSRLDFYTSLGMNATGNNSKVTVAAVHLNRSSILGSVVDTTTSALFTNFTLPNMAVSLQTSGADLTVDFSAYIAGSTAGSIVEVQLLLDGTVLNGSIRGFTTGVANAQADIAENYFASPVAPGNHTVLAQWRTTGVVATTTIGGNRQLSAREVAS